jgi:hypothetical protein
METFKTYRRDFLTDTGGANGFGFLTMAFGAQRYMDQALALAKSFRRHMPNERLCLVTDRETADPVFDDVVTMDPFGVPGTILKTRLYDYSPYDETFFIDSDSIVCRNFSEHVEKMRAWDITPVCNSYLKRGDRDLWLRDVGAALDKVGGDAFPKFNGGVYFFRRSDFASELFERTRQMMLRADELGIIDFDSAGPGDETVMGLAFAEMKVGPLYDDNFGLMRTPLNSVGRIVADPFSGKSEIFKNGRRMSPAIVHFCGAYASHVTYLRAQRALELGHAPSPFEELKMQAQWRWTTLGKRLSARFGMNGSSP